MRQDKLIRVPLRLLLALFLLGGFVAPVAAQPAGLPPVAVPATHEHHTGKVIFVELVTPDLAAAEHFYGGLLGWTFRDIALGRTHYGEAMLAGRPVAGLFQRRMNPNAHRRSAWLTFISVPDATAAAQTATHLGGKVLFGPRTFPDRGSEAVLADPQGAVFAVLASTSGDPPDSALAPAEWAWSSLITSDPDAAAAFYQGLFGYEVFDLSQTGPARHLVLASGGFARASVNSLPSSRPHEHPHWLNFVRVLNAQATAEKVVALGGRILVQPRLGRSGDTIALAADPEGAVFGLLEAAPGTNQGASR